MANIRRKTPRTNLYRSKLANQHFLFNKPLYTNMKTCYDSPCMKLNIMKIFRQVCVKKCPDFNAAGPFADSEKMICTGGTVVTSKTTVVSISSILSHASVKKR